MNCNKSAHIQFASHLVVVNDTNYICTFLQYTADLSWIKHNQASWMGLGSFLERFKRRPEWNTVVKREEKIRCHKVFPTHILIVFYIPLSRRQHKLTKLEIFEV